MMIEKGDFILAKDKLQNSYFEDTIIFILEHGEESGTYGLILNRVCTMPLNEVLTDLSLDVRGQHQFHLGGPVDETLLQVLQVSSQGTQDLVTQFDFEKGDRQQASINLLNLFSQPNIRFFLGYSGWSEFQLANEIEQGCWDVLKVRPQVVFEKFDLFNNQFSPANFKETFC